MVVAVRRVLTSLPAVKVPLVRALRVKSAPAVLKSSAALMGERMMHVARVQAMYACKLLEHTAFGI